MKSKHVAIWAAAGSLAIGAATGVASSAAADDTEKAASKMLDVMNRIATSKRPAATELSGFHGGKSRLNAEVDTIQKICEADEVDFLSAESSLIHPWRAAWQGRDVKAFRALTTKAFEGPLFAKADIVETRTDAGVTEYAWRKVANAAGDAALADVDAYLKKFKQIDDVALETFAFTASKADRNPDTLEPNAATAVIRFDVRGIATDGLRRNDRGMMRASVIREGKTWKLNGLQVINAETIAAKKAAFTDVTATAGIAKLPSYLRKEAIRRGGYAVSLADYDGDGHVDMFVGAAGPSQLLKGDGKGGFTKAENTGLAGETLVKAAVFADFFKSGRQDLLMVRFQPHSTDEMSELVFYKNEGNGKFARLKNIQTKGHFGHAMPAAVADFNNDGLLDFYAGFPGALDFTNLVNSRASGAPVMVQGLFLNNGENFDDASEKSLGAKPVDPALQQTYAHSALSYDYDQDGDMDIAVIDDRGYNSLLYRNDGNAIFTETAAGAGVSNTEFGMSAAVGDLDGDGILDLALTNVNFLAARRLNESCLSAFDKEYDTPAIRGLRLYKGLPGGGYAEVTEPAGLGWAGEGMAGVEFIDYDNDGDLDVYAVNGLWSGTDRTQDTSSLFVRMLARVLDRGSNAIKLSDDDVALMSEAQGMMHMLANYKGDVHGNSATAKSRPALAGFQRNRLFRNDGNARFTEVGYVEGVDSAADGYIVAVADINEDGRADLILRNADPGSNDVSYAPVQVLRNDKATPNKSLVVTLVGDGSNGNGVGAHLTAVVGGKTLTRHLITNNGTAQSQKVVSFGLNGAEKVDTLTIRWPSGATQELKNVPAGTVRIVEPKGGSFAAR